MKKATLAILGSLRDFLPIDHVEMMLSAAVEHLAVSLNHLRIIPEGSSPLKAWAERQLNVDGARLAIYESRLFGGPIRRNNLVITGKGQGLTSSKGKAHAIVILGPIPAHYTRTVERAGEQVEIPTASTQESLVHYWQNAKDAPPIIQVMDDGKDGFKVIDGKQGKWYHLEGDPMAPVLRATNPPPKSGTSSARLAERSSAFWGATK